MSKNCIIYNRNQVQLNRNYKVRGNKSLPFFCKCPFLTPEKRYLRSPESGPQMMPYNGKEAKIHSTSSYLFFSCHLLPPTLPPLPRVINLRTCYVFRHFASEPVKLQFLFCPLAFYRHSGSDKNFPHHYSRVWGLRGHLAQNITQRKPCSAFSLQYKSNRVPPANRLGATQGSIPHEPERQYRSPKMLEPCPCCKAALSCVSVSPSME